MLDWRCRTFFYLPDSSMTRWAIAKPKGLTYPYQATAKFEMRFETPYGLDEFSVHEGLQPLLQLSSKGPPTSSRAPNLYMPYLLATASRSSS